MLAGAAMSRYMTPETCDSRGRSRRLDDLGKGKAWRQEMERDEIRDEESRSKQH